MEALHGGFSSEASRDLPSLHCPVLQTTSASEGGRLVTPRYSEPKKLLFLAKCALSSPEGRGQRRGSPSASVIRYCPKCPGGLTLPTLQRTECSSLSFLDGPGMWKALLSYSRSAVGPLSAQIASGVWGTQISGMSFGFIGPGHGTKTVSPRGMLWKICWRGFCR